MIDLVIEYIKTGANIITVALLVWVVVVQKRGIKTALFEIPAIDPNELKISEFRGGGHNEYVMLKKFKALIEIIKPEIEDARDRIREKIVGYRVDFLRKTDFNGAHIRQSVLVEQMENDFFDVIDRKVYHYLILSVLRRKKPTLSKLIDIIFSRIEKNWNDNERMAKSFLDHCKIEMPIDKDFSEIINDFYDKCEKEMAEIIEEIHEDGHGFSEHKLIASWEAVLIFVISTAEGK